MTLSLHDFLLFQQLTLPAVQLFCQFSHSSQQGSATLVLILRLTWTRERRKKKKEMHGNEARANSSPHCKKKEKTRKEKTTRGGRVGRKEGGRGQTISDRTDGGRWSCRTSAALSGEEGNLSAAGLPGAPAEESFRPCLQSAPPGMSGHVWGSGGEGCEHATTPKKKKKHARLGQARTLELHIHHTPVWWRPEERGRRGLQRPLPLRRGG